jgi:hypothetical protein
MNTVVWIMVMLTNGATHVNTGSEFSSLEKCQRAAEVIAQSASTKVIGNVRTPWCVRIEK